MIRQGWRFNEANDATADEAEVVNKPAKADEAEAYEANNARPYEADAKVDEADKAIVSDKIKVSVIGKIVAADEAIVIGEVIAVDKADESDKALLLMMPMMLSFTLSQNILQSLQKCKNISE